MRTIRSVLTSLTRSPVKSTVTLSTVGLGVGVLIFALSISGAFSRLVSEQLDKERPGGHGRQRRDRDDDGEMQQVRPPQFDGWRDRHAADRRFRVPEPPARSPSRRGRSTWSPAATTASGASSA